MDAFTTQYMATALWAENDNSTPQGGEPLDANYSISDIAPSSLRKMEEDCRNFQRQNAALLDGFYDAGYDLERAGHDFWLNRNGHGSGFWDEDAPRDVIEGLSQASKAFGEQDIYVGDDKKIYVMGGETDQHELPLKASLLKKGADVNQMAAVIQALQQGPKTTKEIEIAVSGGDGKYGVSSWPAVDALKKEGLIVQKQMRWHLTASVLHGLAITGRRHKGRELSVPERHQLRLAIDSMNMNPAMLGVMGGPNVEEARKIIKQLTGREFEQLPKSMQNPSWRRTGSIPASLHKGIAAPAPKNRIKGASVDKTAMSRKDYILIANALKEARKDVTLTDVDHIAEILAKTLKTDNPRFDTQHFLDIVMGSRELTSRPGSARGQVKPKTYETFGPGGKSQRVTIPENEPHEGSVKKAAIPQEALEETVERAQIAFWDAVAAQWPEATSGDLGPDIVGPLEQMMSRACAAWIHYNVPETSSVPDATGYSIASAEVKPRLAGAKYGSLSPELIAQAKDLIEADDPMIYDVAADSGQIVGNVAHMSWFVRAVAEWLAEEQGLGVQYDEPVDMTDEFDMNRAQQKPVL